MCARVAIIYSDPVQSRYHDTGEEKAESGVLEAVNAVQESLASLTHLVATIPVALPQEQAVATVNALDIDVVFNLFEGFPGYPETEAWLPELLIKKGIRYTGCPPEALRLGLNKARTKEVLRDAGVLTPEYQVLNVDTLDRFRLRFPCIIKPAADDASHGLSEESLVNDRETLRKRVKYLGDFYGGEILVEEFIDGREFNLTVAGNDIPTVLPVSEIIYNLPPEKPRILTFAAKWESDSVYFKGTPVMCPAEIDDHLSDNIARIASTAFRTICHRGYARIDLRLDRYGMVNVIEVNPNPDISPNAGAARQAKAAGMTYTQFIQKIIDIAMM